MTALAEFFINAVELIEAQAQKLQGDVGSRVRSLALALVLLVVMGVLLLAGLGWLVSALFLQLLTWMSPAAAAALVGLASIALAGGAGWYALRRRA